MAVCSERSSHIVPLVISTDHACTLLRSLRQLFANGNRLRSVPETLCFLPDLQVTTTVVCTGWYEPDRLVDAVAQKVRRSNSWHRRVARTKC
jgi:hypothetical protein